MDLVARKPDFVAWEQQRRIPDCVFTQSGQRFVIRFLVAIIANYAACEILIFYCFREWFPAVNPKGRFLASRPSYGAN